MATQKKTPAKAANKPSRKSSDLGGGSGTPKGGSDLDGGSKEGGKGKSGGATQSKKKK